MVYITSADMAYAKSALLQQYCDTHTCVFYITCVYAYNLYIIIDIYRSCGVLNPRTNYLIFSK